MRKIVILLLSFLLLNVANGEESRNCDTIYSEINGVKYFGGLYCSEDISLNGVVAEKLPLKVVSLRIVNDFIISNNSKIIEHVDGGSGTCDGVDSIPAIQEFEETIYSKNDIGFTSTTSNIETLTTEIETLIEESNSKTLYGEIFDETKQKFPISSNNFIVIATKDAYFEKLDEIKEDAINKQKEKLTLIYKLTESQKIIGDFYDRVDRICESYIDSQEKSIPKQTLSDKLNEKFGNNEDRTDEEIKEKKINKYKEEFNVKLGSKLDSLPRQTLQQLSVKLIGYAYTSKIFARFSEAQKAIVVLKIAGLKAAIDDRLN